MKILNTIMLLLAICTFAYAQPDKFETERGDLEIQPVLHSTMVIKWNGKTIYTDPYGGEESFAQYAAPDLVLITTHTEII